MTLEELEKLAESGFTLGPWDWSESEEGGFAIDAPSDDMHFDLMFVAENIRTIQDTKLIAAAPSLLATAIAAKKREKELVEALRRMLGEFAPVSQNTAAVKARAILKDIEQ